MQRHVIPFYLDGEAIQQKENKNSLFILLRKQKENKNSLFYIGSGRPAHSARSEENKKSKYIYSERLMYELSYCIKFIIFFRIIKYIVKCP
jgi:hypothetical protein